MQIIKYDINFVKELGINYKSSLKPEVITTFELLKKKFNINIGDNISSTKKIQQWRNPNVEEKTKKTGNNTIKEIYLHLNKLSDSNIETISFQINNLIIEDKSDQDNIVEKLVNRLFQNAKIQIHFCHLYAYLFSKLIHENRKLYFDKINNKIKLEFEKIESMVPSDAEGDYNNYCDTVQLKDNYIGCYQFCVELYSYNVLTIDNITQIINNIIQDLEKQTEICRIEIIVESICRIMSTLIKNKRIESKHLEKLVKIIKIGFVQNKEKLNPRSRFLYEDAINAKV